MDWFRFYTEALHDPKVQRLPLEAFRAWVNLLCLARLKEGVIPRGEVAYHLRIPEVKAAAILDTLKTRGLLDETDHGLMPHNWDERQPSSDSSAERMRRHRANKKRNSDAPSDRHGDVTVTVQSREEKNRTEKEQRGSVTSTVANPFTEDGFTEFREVFSEYGLKASEQDWKEAHTFEWKRLDFHQRLAAVKGIRDRLEAGATNDPAASALPKNYLGKRMWDRAIRIDRPKGRDAVEEILGTTN